MAIEAAGINDAGSSVSSPGSYTTLTHDSLPDASQMVFDNAKVFSLVGEAVTHYGASAGFLAMESDEDKLHLRARHGMPLKTLGLDSIARHAIKRHLPIIVEDANQVDHFASDQLVSGDMAIRFAIIAPLVLLPSMSVGSFCIMDTKPRSKVTLDDCQFLVDTASRIMDEYRSVDTSRAWAVPVTLDSLPRHGTSVTDEDEGELSASSPRLSEASWCSLPNFPADDQALKDPPPKHSCTVGSLPSINELPEIDCEGHTKVGDLANGGVYARRTGKMLSWALEA